MQRKAKKKKKKNFIHVEWILLNLASSVKRNEIFKQANHKKSFQQNKISSTKKESK